MYNQSVTCKRRSSNKSILSFILMLLLLLLSLTFYTNYKKKKDFHKSSFEFQVQSTVVCMSVSVSGSATLACLFLPKIYIVLFHPEKNVRYPSSSPTSSTPSISITPVRFLRSGQNSPTTPHRMQKSSELNISTENNFLMINKTTGSNQSSPSNSQKMKKSPEFDNNFLTINKPSTIMMTEDE